MFFRFFKLFMKHRGTISIALFGGIVAVLFMVWRGKYPGITAKEVISYVLGMVSLNAWVVPLVGVPVSLAGLVIGFLALGSSYSVGLTGIVLSSVGLLLSTVNFVMHARSASQAMNGEAK